MLFSKRTKKIPDLSVTPLPSYGKDHDHALQHTVEEIKSMRAEINWRVQSAYASSIAFIAFLGFAGQTIFSSSSTLMIKLQSDPQLLFIVATCTLIIISAWVGVQNANHLIEKRIELYTLDLLKSIYANYNHVFFAWLGFLYGSTYFNNKFGNGVAKFLNASIGMFIYLLPNVVALIIWIYMLCNFNISEHWLFFSAASVFFMVSMGSSFMFFFYIIKIDKLYTDFYKKVMKPYYKKNSF